MPGLRWNIGRLGFTPQQSKLQCGFKWNLTRDDQYALLLPFVPVWGDKMHMIRIRLYGLGGGKLLDVDIQGKMQGNWKKSA